MATLTVGGEAYSVSLNVYARLKRAWKYIAVVKPGVDPYVANDAIIGVTAVGLDGSFPGEPVSGGKDAIEAWRIEYIGDHLAVEEIKGLVPMLNVLLSESGLVEPGEPEAAESPSTETLTPSSQS